MIFKKFEAGKFTYFITRDGDILRVASKYIMPVKGWVWKGIRFVNIHYKMLRVSALVKRVWGKKS